MSILDRLLGVSTQTQRFMPHVNDFVIALLILFIGMILGKILGKITRRTLLALDADKLIRRTVGQQAFSKIFSISISYVIYIATIIIVLERIGVLSTIWIILLVIILIGILAGTLQTLLDLFPNLMGRIHMGNRFSRGQKTTIAGMKGTILKVGLLSTLMLNEEGEKVIFSNAYFRSRH